MTMFSDKLKQFASKSYAERKQYYTAIMADLEAGFATCSEDEVVLMEFFYGTMPVRDAGEYEFSLLLAYVKHAIRLRKEVEWCRTLPEDIFVHYVLYYRINSEDISDSRELFYDSIIDRVKDLSMEEAVFEVNYWCAEHATYEAADMRTASPLTLLRAGKGRCGEESTFTTHALRSVGIPARQIYAPRWAHCADNHAWVEVYMNGAWEFLGACEPEAIMNKGWFIDPANRAMFIHCLKFSNYEDGLVEEFLDQDQAIVYSNVTKHYAHAKPLTITVLDQDQKPVDGAKVAIEVLNMSEYFPVAEVLTKADGKASISLGYGDTKVRAYKGDVFGEAYVSTTSSDEVSITLGKCESWRESSWEETRLVAPVIHPVRSLVETKEQEEGNAARIAQANTIREAHFAQVRSMYSVDDFFVEKNIPVIAGENLDELTSFYQKNENPKRKAILNHLAVKDYKDAKADVLEDFVGQENTGYDAEIFERFVLAPRIFFEPLSPYKSFICSYFSEEQKQQFIANPESIRDFIEEHIAYDSTTDYNTIVASPIGCLKMKHGNENAKKILFVAICRSLGIPARLNRSTMETEFYQNGSFVTKEKTATLKLTAAEGDEWNYYQNWSLGKLEGTKFESLHCYMQPFEDGVFLLNLEAGIYRIVVSSRHPNGNQQTASYVFKLEQEEIREIPLYKVVNKEHDTKFEIPDFDLEDESGARVKFSSLAVNNVDSFVFLGVGQEPTEHVFNELLEMQNQWNEEGMELIAILRTPKDLENRTLQKVLQAVNGIHIYFDCDNAVQLVSEAAGVDANRLPVLVVAKDTVTGLYSSAGYNVGSVRVVQKIMEENS